MTVPISALPRIRAEIVDRLMAAFAAIPGMTDVVVLWDMDEDQGNEDARTVIGVIDTASVQELVGARPDGQNSAKEVPSVRVGVKHVEKGTARETNPRAWAVAQALSDVIRTDQTLGAALQGVASIGEVVEGSFKDSRGLWEHRIDIEIRCPSARLRP